ncbi:hypothetical protein H4R18_002887 [Coemansia javaensis]|uniref:Uncharacterized protein n=1 Tax=Coemansia javaensis TaxID=2761396 RepID=A0A9W8LJE1_9FUNG|nr:hypothetical protein H4R18_002887 [Coemansia javaensis]
MDEYRSAKGTRLAFKGDAAGPKKAKRRPKRPRGEEGAAAAAAAAAGQGRPGGWVAVSSLDDLVGPVALHFHGAGGGLCALSLPLASEALGAGGGQLRPAFHRLPDGAPPAAARPSRVEEVFVGRRSVPTAARADPEYRYFSFKSCRGEYLSAGRDGSVACCAAAIGPLEMWTPVLLPERGDGAIALAIRPPGADADQYLTIDDGEHASLAALVAPARSDAAGPRQVFVAKCQAAIRASSSSHAPAADAGGRRKRARGEPGP